MSTWSDLPGLLDQGLLIYRRHWAPLLTFSAGVMLPVTAIGLLMSAAISRDFWKELPLAWLALGGGASVALLVYLLVGLACAARACLLGQRPAARALFALACRPALRLSLYALAYWFGAQILVALLSMLLGRAVGLVFDMFADTLRGVLLDGVDRLTGAFLSLITIVPMVLFNTALFWLSLSMPLMLLLYALQRRLEEPGPAGYTPQGAPRGVVWLASAYAMLMVGAPALGFALTSLVVWVQFGLSDWLFIWVVLPLVALCWTVLLPLPAVWTALLHQRQRQTVMGDDLDARVRSWLAA
jgi:hypothetical protein